MNQPCVFQVVRVSGTIKKAEEEAIRRARLSIRRAQRTSGKANLVLPGNASTVGAPVAGAEDNDDTSMGFADGIEDVDEPGDFDEDD